MSRVIFLDIDGPMIPGRAAHLPNQTYVYSVFDPVATSLVLKLIEKSGARIVISSSHGFKGLDHIIELFELNGIDPSLIHPDWITPRKMSSYRIHEIGWWLDNHPEITHYVAIDDEQLSVGWVKNSVQCDAYEGFSFRNYLECCLYLGVYDESTEDGQRKHTEAKRMVQYLKQREIYRTVRLNEPEYDKIKQIAKDLFPL